MRVNEISASIIVHEPCLCDMSYNANDISAPSCVISFY